MRAPGMTMMKMPIFCWTTLASNAIIVTIFPVLTATLALLALDRYVGTHFFTNDFGGNSMMYMNLIWIWGHPEVYVLVLPAFGIYSEVVSTFCGKRLFGYTSMVYATAVIALVSWLTWLHHFFTMGSGANVNAFFGITTMIISIPTGAKVFNWLFTMYRGQDPLRGADDLGDGLHPDLRARRLDGRAARGAARRLRPAQQPVPGRALPQRHHRRRRVRAACGRRLLVPQGFRLQARPVLGKGVVLVLAGRLLGRVHAASTSSASWASRAGRSISTTRPCSPILTVAAIGAFIIMAGIAAFVIQLVVSYLRREQLRDLTGDPWGGRTLEWSTSSPPPPYNFAFTPVVHDLDAWWDMKKRGYDRPSQGFRPIHMPKNTGAGVVLAGLSTVLGFALIWYIWWLAALSFVALIAAAIVHTFNYDRDYLHPGRGCRPASRA